MLGLRAPPDSLAAIGGLLLRGGDGEVGEWKGGEERKEKEGRDGRKGGNS